MDRPISEKLRVHKTGYYKQSIVIYPNPNKQYSSKHSWSGILIQYSEQTKDDGTKIKISHPIIYQSGTFQGSQKNWNILMKRVYAIYMSFQKMVFYLKEAHVMVWSNCSSSKICVLSNKNDKVNNWPQEIHAMMAHIKF